MSIGALKVATHRGIQALCKRLNGTVSGEAADLALRLA